MDKNICCFLGHRTINETEELKSKLIEIIEKLIVNEKVDTFLFGSKSQFDSLCLELVSEIKEKYPHKTIWLYTGDTWEKILHYALLQYVDVLVDGEFHIHERDVKLQWKGSKNQRVIDVQKTLQQTDPTVPVLHCGDYS